MYINLLICAKKSSTMQACGEDLMAVKTQNRVSNVGILAPDLALTTVVPCCVPSPKQDGTSGWRKKDVKFSRRREEDNHEALHCASDRQH